MRDKSINTIAFELASRVERVIKSIGNKTIGNDEYIITIQIDVMDADGSLRGRSKISELPELFIGGRNG